MYMYDHFTITWAPIHLPLAWTATLFLCCVWYLICLRSAVVLTPILIGVTLHWLRLKHHQVRIIQTLVTQMAIRRKIYMRYGKSQDNGLKAFGHNTRNCKKAVIFDAHYRFFHNCNSLYMGNGFHGDFFRKKLCGFVCSVQGPQAKKYKCKCYWQSQACCWWYIFSQ